MTQIVLVGAGSTSFGSGMILDLVAHAEQLGTATIVLHDVDAAALDTMLSAARRLATAAGAAGLRFDATTDLRVALQGAGFVIVSVAVDRLATWRHDWEIPRRHGVRQVLGENGGPGGLSHTLRSVPLMLGVARVIEEVAPEALVLNFTNPMSRVCLALSRATRLRVVGLCHQIGAAYRIAGQVLGLVADEHEARERGHWLHEQLAITAAGLNHLTFIQDMRDAHTGADLYPAFRERLAAMPAGFEPLSRRIDAAFGLFPATGDGHAGEYLSFAWETSPLTGYDFTGRAEHAAAQRAQFEAVARGQAPVAPYLGRQSGERAVQIICATLGDRRSYELAVNVPNHGSLAGLPDWAIVEVPAVVGAAGVTPLRIAPLPAGITALLAQQVAVQDRAVAAALHGDRQAALQALLLDPVVDSHATATALLDELLGVHAAYLPQFARA
ncbi:MAG: alpha-glucosidase/alpha-galactosidase [Chloroflexi bacterium]|nr:alpha-glucosidase/alpha-galactosidase [Chloroflexota bacterium]